MRADQIALSGQAPPDLYHYAFIEVGKEFGDHFFVEPDIGVFFPIDGDHNVNIGPLYETLLIKERYTVKDAFLTIGIKVGLKY